MSRLNWDSLLVSFLSFGRSEAEFWSLTLRQYDRFMRGMRVQEVRAHNARAHQEWLGAQLSGWADPKALPRLEALMIVDKPKRQTIEEMIETLKQVEGAHRAQAASLNAKG